MKAYTVSVNLKLGLIGFAVVIAVSSLWYTSQLVDRLREREATIVQLWARALVEIPRAEQQSRENPYRPDFRELEGRLPALRGVSGWSAEETDRLIRAMAWAQSMPPTSNLEFITQAFLLPNAFAIPAIIADSLSGSFQAWRNVDVAHESYVGLDSTEQSMLTASLEAMKTRMAAQHDPIPIVVTFPGDPPERLVQRLYYGESDLVVYLRWFPYVQILFVGLFILVGYVGFSYVRRSEQSSLWVGMAKEAAHQLGTPISSLMGWMEMLRMRDDPDGSLEQTCLEIEEDISRLNRVASRFSDIGSLPKLDSQPVGPVLEHITEYMRKRLPQRGAFIRLQVSAPALMEAPINAELFEWVIENLLKNAIDAIETERGRIDVIATEKDGAIQIDVSDTGKGIDRRQFKNVFRPGYSTKKRGWGLGLSLAKRIVEDYHGGSLTLAASRVGEGSTFRVRIPSTSPGLRAR